MKIDRRSDRDAMGKRIAAELEQQDISPSHAARECGVTPQAVDQWLKGETSPRYSALLKLSSLLSVTPEYLQFGTPSVPLLGSEELVIIHVNARELAIVNEFRKSTDLGKRQLELGAVGTEKLPPEQWPGSPNPEPPAKPAARKNALSNKRIAATPLPGERAD